MKYQITYACGHEGEIVLFGKYADRKRKIEFFENSGSCPECYKKEKQAEAEKEPIKLHMAAEAAINDEGEPLIRIWLTGNTKPIKDDLKSLGFRWDRWAPSLFEMPFYAWSISVTCDKIEEYASKAIALGAEYDDPVRTISPIEDMNFHIACRMSERWHKTHDAIQLPAKLNGKWNRKIYGKKGSYRVYLDGAETPLTDAEAAEARKYLAELEEAEQRSSEA